MAHSVFTNEMSNKVDSTPVGYTTDEASGRLLASGFTPPSNREAEIQALRSANCKLQARLSGYLVFRKYCMSILYLINFGNHSRRLDF